MEQDKAGQRESTEVGAEVADLAELRRIQSHPHNRMLLLLLWEAGGSEVEASYSAMAERELCEKAYELISGKRWSAGRPRPSP